MSEHAQGHVWVAAGSRLDAEDVEWVAEDLAAGGAPAPACERCERRYPAAEYACGILYAPADVWADLAIGVFKAGVWPTYGAHRAIAASRTDLVTREPVHAPWEVAALR